jgi:putative acetyltransferase
MRDLHVASIREVASSHYNPAQIAAWSGNRKPSQYRQWMADGLTMWVALRGKRLAGFAGSSCGELHVLFVHPDQIGRGVGSALLEEVERDARRSGAANLLCPASLNAISFYRRRGFRPERRGSLRFGGTAVPYVAMRKKL